MSSEKQKRPADAAAAREVPKPATRPRRIQVAEARTHDRPAGGSIALSFAVVRRDVEPSLK